MYYLLGYCISYKTTRTNFLMIKRVKLLWTYQQINSTKTVFPEMRGKVIYNSKNSWLVLKTVVLMEVSLFNIVSKDLVQLANYHSCHRVGLRIFVSFCHHQVKVIVVLSSLTACQIHSTIGNLEKGNFMNNGFVSKIVP